MGKNIEIPDNVATNFFCGHVSGTQTGDVYFARCSVCGDSEKNTSKKRLFLLKKKNSWFVYCHNCGYASPLLRFIKDFYPMQYDKVVEDCVTDFFTDKKKDKNEEMNLLIESLSKKVKKKISLMDNLVKKYIETDCVTLTSNCGNESVQSVVNEQIELLKKRRIKDCFIEKLFYAFDGKYKDRVIIPFFNKDREPYYFQAKATKQSQKGNKYINWEQENTEKPIYNEYFVDKSKTVFILEGIFDSLFVDNAIATLGAQLSANKIKSIKKQFPDVVWILDNDITGISRAKKLLDKSEKCFIMPYKYKRIKDLNDLAIVLKLDDLNEIVNDNVYNGVEGIIEFSRR